MKRRMFARILSMGVFASFFSSAHAQQSDLKPTPQDAEGPYYPESWNVGDVDADLTVLNGMPYSRGIPMEIVGWIRTTSGSPVAGATVEIWQADDTGKYRHSRDDGDGPPKRGFQGFGRTKTDAQGQYRFNTIKPAVYESRPAHVHFRVKATQMRTLTTQMYFAKENSERGRFSAFGGFSKERDVLTVEPRTRTDNGRSTLLVQFDLVLATP